MSDNLKLWDAVCTTPPSKTKKAKLGGNTITAIDPQYQRRLATEQFGPFGIGWGLKDEKWEYLDIGDTKLCHYSATLWYEYAEEEDTAPDRGEFPVNANGKVSYMTQGYGDKPGYLKVDDEYSKKVQTNALTKGLSALGFNSDVFEGLYDDNKYVQEQARLEKEGGSGVGQQKSPSAGAQGTTAVDNEKAARVIMATLKLEEANVVAFCKSQNSSIHLIGDIDAATWAWLANTANMDKVMTWCNDQVPS